MSKTISSIIIVVVVVAAGWYLVKHGTGGSSAVLGANDTIATVNGAVITRADLTKAEAQIAAGQGLSATSTAVQAQFQADALNTLIGQTLLMQAAAQAGFTASSTEVDSQLAATKAQFPAPTDYEKALSTRGMTEDDLRTKITQNLVLNAYLEQQLKLSSTTATDAEIKATYSQLAAESGTSTPPLSKVRTEVEQMVVQQKQQESVNAYVAQLRSAADVKILIATSTPAI